MSRPNSASHCIMGGLVSNEAMLEPSPNENPQTYRKRTGKT
jgi:hypothetical protein